MLLLVETVKLDVCKSHTGPTWLNTARFHAGSVSLRQVTENHGHIRLMVAR